jgi:hypothetical protein
MRAYYHLEEFHCHYHYLAKLKTIRKESMLEEGLKEEIKRTKEENNFNYSLLNLLDKLESKIGKNLVRYKK